MGADTTIMQPTHPRVEIRFDGLSRVGGECVWALQQVPDALGSVADVLRALIADVKAGGVPIAPTALPFENAVAVRPKGHQRAFYIPVPAAAGDQTPRGYVAVKGTEPILVDELRYLSATGLPLSWMDDMSIIDHFPVVEHKVPMVLTVGEALDEATAASAVYGPYIERYGEIPDLPLPLLVVKWPAEIAERVREVLAPLLSPFAEKIVDRILLEGAAAYLYYYPAAPFPRVRHVAAALRDAGARRMAGIDEFGSPGPVIERWARLFTRLLALGYLPATRTQSIAGQAIQAQNVVIGAGFVDVDSVRPLDDFKHDRDLFESYALSFIQLSNTVARYLFRGVNENPGFGSPEVFAYLHVYQLVSDLVEEERRRYGDDFDPRLRDFPPFRRGVEGLLRLAARFQQMPELAVLTRMLEGGLPV